MTHQQAQERGRVGWEVLPCISLASRGRVGPDAPGLSHVAQAATGVQTCPECPLSCLLFSS